MLNVEFHCHTIFSKDSLTRPATLVETCRRKGIDRVIVTDHNSIQGALQAKEIDPKRVIVGEEIMTDQGEILAAFVTDEIPEGLPAREVITRLRKQGAFISVSHPFDHQRGGFWKLHELEAIAPHVDAIETFNARCLLPNFNDKASAFAKQHHLPGTVGSDAHSAVELGSATLLLPDFIDADSLKAIISQGQFQGGLSPWWIHFFSTFATWAKKLKLVSYQ